MNDNSEFKCELINLLSEFLNYEELEEKFGCTLEFVADGMIDSIPFSVNIAHLAKLMEKEDSRKDDNRCNSK